MSAPAAATTLGDLAIEVRSKNAGPFWLTLDVFFDSAESFQRVVEAGVIAPETVAALYAVPVEGVEIFAMPSILAIKISFPRPVVAGCFADRDLHAGQQHVLLAGLTI